ncbi:hypothetical protein Hanom_Chr04g00355921 [Helianthus anomalus]
MWLQLVKPREETFSFFDVPSSPPRDADVDMGVNEEFRRSPSIEVVTAPSAHAEDTGKKAAGQTIFDTVDSSDNLIEPPDTDVEGGDKPKSPDAEKPKPLLSRRFLVLPPRFYYRSYTENQGVNYHLPPWTVIQGDDISNDPFACRDILSSLGTHFEVLRARGLSRENRINQISSMLETVRLRAEAEAMVKAAREGAEQLEREKAAFEKLKQTESWTATVGLKQVHTLAKLLSDERKGWREACARENEKHFPYADRNNLIKAVENFKVEVQNWVTILEEVTARANEAETRAREAAEARNSLVTSLDQLKADHDWMRDHGIGHSAQHAGFKAGYNACIAHVNLFFQSKFTDERSGLHGVDTEGLYAAAINAYKNLSLSAIEDIEHCLEAKDYVDRLCLLYECPEMEETAGGAKGDAGTSGTKED